MLHVATDVRRRPPAARARRSARRSRRRRRRRRGGAGARARARARAGAAGPWPRPWPAASASGPARGRQHARAKDPLVHAPVEVGVVPVVAPPRASRRCRSSFRTWCWSGASRSSDSTRAVDHRREALAAVRRPRDDEPAARLERVRVDVGLRRRVPVGGRRRVLLRARLRGIRTDGEREFSEDAAALEYPLLLATELVPTGRCQARFWKPHCAAVRH